MFAIACRFRADPADGDAPGTTFNYNGGNPYLLSALINKKSGQNALDYAKSLPEKGAYMALGRHRQLMLVIPKLDVVAVMTGALKDNESYSVTGLIDDISRAVKSDKALQADPIAIALLANAIHQAATEKASAIGGMPELAKAIGVDVMTGPARILRSCGLVSSQAQRWLILSPACRGALLPAGPPREHVNRRRCPLRSRAGD